jgi:hypothetical protein
MAYHPSPQAKATTGAVQAAFDTLPAKRKRDASFRADMLAAQVKSRGARKGQKVPFSQKMALEVVGKISLLAVRMEAA